MKDLNHDLEQLRKMVEGDAGSFRLVFERHRAKVLSYAYGLTKSMDTAEEIVQNVFVRLWQKREQIDTSRNFRAYLKKITLNEVLNFLKKASRQAALQREIYARMELMRNSTEENLLEKELRQIYQEAIGKLPPQKKLIFQLSRQENLSHEQIAERLRISKNTVNNHLVEAMSFIRRYVSTHAGLAHMVLTLLMSCSVE